MAGLSTSGRKQTSRGEPPSPTPQCPGGWTTNACPTSPLAICSRAQMPEDAVRVQVAAANSSEGVKSVSAAEGRRKRTWTTLRGHSKLVQRSHGRLPECMVMINPIQSNPIQTQAGQVPHKRASFLRVLAHSSCRFCFHLCLSHGASHTHRCHHHRCRIFALRLPLPLAHVVVGKTLRHRGPMTQPEQGIWAICPVSHSGRNWL